MLQLTPEQTVALEQVERTLLVRRLERYFGAQWPAVAGRLGSQLPAFVEFALAGAERHGLRIAAGAVRYVNLCFVWGSAFDDKPGFEWARTTLSEPGRHEWQKVHQLVRRSVEELAARPGSPISGEQLTQADQEVTQAFAGLGLLGRLLRREAVELPLVACDLDLAALRTSDAGSPMDYELGGGKAKRVPAPGAPPPFRVDSAQPAWPERLHVLTRSDKMAGHTRLQMRVVPHAVCDAQWHPHVALAGSHGLWEWRGEEAGSVSCELEAAEHSAADPTLGVAIGEELLPEISRLQVTTCALREEGVPIGSGSIQLWTYPTRQCLLEMARSKPTRLAWPGHEADIAPTRVALECDGQPLDTTGWSQGFESLDAQLAGAIARIGAAWERTAGLEKVEVAATAGALCGTASLTWGWRQGSGGYASPPLMRIQGDFDLLALAIDIECRGELQRDGARASLRLRATGEAPLRLQLNRQLEQPPLDEMMASAVRRFRIPFELELQSLAVAESAVLNLGSPCSGALVGEAGLRRRVEGGGGWQWYVRLQVEPVAATLTLDDPLLGQTRFECNLLPPLVALAWSLG